MSKTDTGTTTRTPKAEITRDKLLRRAADLFAKHGYDGVGLQQIAEVAGVTKGSLYYHFENKRQIYMECVAQVVSAAFSANQPPILTGTPEARLDQYLKWLLSVLKGSNLARRLLLYMVMDHDVELMERLMKGIVGQSLDMFMSILRGLKVKKDKAVLAYFFYSICMLNDELTVFADTWLPNLGSKVGDLKAARYLKAMIKTW